MIDVFWRNGLLPLVATRIEEVETATGVFQPDARAAVILGGLGVVGVVAGEDEHAVLLCQADIDSGRGVAVHAVLEGVLDEGDKKKWGHFELRIEN